jgi:predicted AAA+ superfamily ATPase
MPTLSRNITQHIQSAIARGKSILLLGARQTGKTTAVLEQVKPDITYSFLDAEVRLRYEKDPTLLLKELKLELPRWKIPPLIFVDEIQKIPEIMDTIQLLIDQKQAKFILTGSSVRKLRHGKIINLLPGRVVVLTMDPLHFDELPKPKPDLMDILLYGTLPHIFLETEYANKETDLRSYVTTYLEEEIRAEALVRNLGHFARFLELAASESGHIVSFTKLSQEIGVAVSTISEYYQVLEDCMVVFRVDTIIKSASRRRLIKAPKFLFFDLGIRRVAANEGIRLPEKHLGSLFEQYVGIELIHQSRQFTHAQVHYWRDASGVEVDYVLQIEKEYVPIEVKWTEMPSMQDARHVAKFLAEYDNAKRGYIVCRTPSAFEITDNIIALPWQEIDRIMEGFCDAEGEKVRVSL